MATLVSKPAPDFGAQAVMPDGSFKQIELSDYKGKYVVLFFYPLDFTFVCPTEIIGFSDKQADFEKRNTQVIGVSIDSHFSHLAWRNTDRKNGGLGDIAYPLVADVNKKITYENISKAKLIISKEFSPLSDVRGSKNYRTKIVSNLLDRFWNEYNNKKVTVYDF